MSNLTGNVGRHFSESHVESCERTLTQELHQNQNDLHPPYLRPIRMLRLAQVINLTGLGKTKIYELQAEGDFPMRIKITSTRVCWVEEEIQTWLARRILHNTPL